MLDLKDSTVIVDRVKLSAFEMNPARQHEFIR